MHETQKQETHQPNFIELREMWMVEWSEAQGWFHVGTVEEMIGKNIRSYIHGNEAGYSIVGITDTQEDAEKLMHLLRKRRKTPLPDPLADHLITQNEDVEIVAATAPPPAGKYRLKPLASAARTNHFKPMPVGDDSSQDQLADLAMFADSVFELRSPEQAPTASSSDQAASEPLASAARRNGLEPVKLNDGHEIIPYKRR